MPCILAAVAHKKTPSFCWLCCPKPSLKIGSVNKVFLFWYWQRLKFFFLRNKTFLFFKLESWNFQNLFEIELCETLQNFNSLSFFRHFFFHFFYWFSDWVEILWNSFSNRFWKFQFSILKIKKDLFLEKRLSRCQYKKQKSFVYRPNFQWRFWTLLHCLLSCCAD